MTKQMEAVLAEALTRALQVAEKTGDFVVEQSPEVVQQLLLYNFTHSLLSSVFGIVLFVTMSVIGFKLHKKALALQEGSSFPDPVFPWVPFILGITFGGLTLALCFNTEWLKIWIAPKLYLLEYAADLIK